MMGLSAVCECGISGSYSLTFSLSPFRFICCLRAENALAKMCLYAFIYVARAIAIRHCYTQLKFRHFMCWLVNVKS